MTVRIVHLSDIHFGCENTAALDEVRRQILDQPPDLVAVTGDITQAGYPREFAAARDWLDALPCPTISTPGNHDTPYWNVIGRMTRPFGAYRRYVGPDSFEQFVAPGLRAVAINTARGIQPP